MFVILPHTANFIQQPVEQQIAWCFENSGENVKRVEFLGPPRVQVFANQSIILYHISFTFMCIHCYITLPSNSFLLFQFIHPSFIIYLRYQRNMNILTTSLNNNKHLHHGTSTGTFMSSNSESNLADYPNIDNLVPTNSNSFEDVGFPSTGGLVDTVGDDNHEEDSSPAATPNKMKIKGERAAQLSTTLTAMMNKDAAVNSSTYLMKDASRSEIMSYLYHRREMQGKLLKVSIAFRNLSVWTMASTKPKISTVASAFQEMMCGSKEIKERFDVLKSASGMLKPHTMTLLLGPPGCGRSLLMKLLSHRLTSAFTNSTIEGEVLFNGDILQSGRFIPGKVVDYVEQTDNHAPLLTVEETLRYAWMCTAEHENGKVDQQEADIAVQNMLTILGLRGCKDTLVGDESTRGISGGEKRRLTLGEMLISNRPVKIMDSITDGLDAATAFDILRYLRDACSMLGHTYLIALHQPSPPVYELFDEVILMSEGKIIYQGSRSRAKTYFESLGFIWPIDMEEVEFLQEITTSDGRRFLDDKQIVSSKMMTHSDFLANAWLESSIFQSMLLEIPIAKSTDGDLHDNKVASFLWPSSCTNAFQRMSWWFYLYVTLQKYMTIELRSRQFYFVRLYPTVIVGVLVGTIYQGIGLTDTFTMTGFLFFNITVPAMGQFSLMPRIYAHKHWHYKFSDALYYPSSVFNIAQSLFAYPLFTIETLLGCLIQYWIVGLSADDYGARFAFYIFVTLLFTLVITKFFRVLSIIFADCEVAVAMGGVMMLFLSLFSGFIQSINATPVYWKWFFYINPCAWSLTALSINEYKSSRYDVEMCADVKCDTKQRFGDIALEQYGHPTDENYEWFCVLILFIMYIGLIAVNDVLLRWKRTVPTPAIPVREELPVDASNDAEATKDLEAAGHGNDMLSLPFDPITMTFQQVEYKVPGAEKGTEITLLSKIEGYFEPGTMTALMGSTGAGKTTLMDVLAARKNQGTRLGEIMINGKSTSDPATQFKAIMAYVEQFDALPNFSTAREAITFSARLRLPSSTSADSLQQWVDTVVWMVELHDIEHRMIGTAMHGGMSFEQRKRVSIAVELAANPSIMFLDEPTTGLDSRSAEVVIRNIRTIANTGRTVVCTIHQPSPSVFFSFDKLLLLQNGGKVAYFGGIGANGNQIVDYFQELPNSLPLEIGKNPSTWMLECIGAGTIQHQSITNNKKECVTSTKLEIDCADIFINCNIYEQNHIKLQELVEENNNQSLSPSQKRGLKYQSAPWLLQCIVLAERTWLSYWRNPGYNLTRIMQNVFVSIVFASAYIQYKCEDVTDVMALVTVLLMTSVSCSILAMMVAVPVAIGERTVFYREQQSKMYSVFLYTMIQSIVEVSDHCLVLSDLHSHILIQIPYLALASLAFVVPFFFIVGIDSFGDQPVVKFFYYWLLSGLTLAFNVFYGQFLVASLPDHSTAQSKSH